MEMIIFPNNKSVNAGINHPATIVIFTTPLTLFTQFGKVENIVFCIFYVSGDYLWELEHFPCFSCRIDCSVLQRIVGTFLHSRTVFGFMFVV